ncbi:PaaX family transcriptional regulator C-terminal domain-containing protein [uncultured Roseobacter sp.]|uniref:PaaX family transcriptional regulator C-terminal domain-containing protein n=1 Tax=uncultured Roseobacter sp. TaxID=114847 RepID=UPI0026152CCE|nr:PaaX family transcriptional regulator C-terminal domain-containing protein [uncultured Roseobacter sp.]
MSQPLHQDLVRCLTEETLPPVWSLLVTVFGDLAQAPGAQVSGRALSSLGDAIGVKPAALRVALHRLRKDGWIESRRSGRGSFHQLTETGLQQSIAATPRIYGTARPSAEAYLSVFDRMGDKTFPEGVWVMPNTLISAADPVSGNAFTTSLSPNIRLPEWMREKICPRETLAQAIAFAERLDRCVRLMEETRAVSVRDIAVLRVLVVHGWRRIVLKVPALPDHLFPEPWPGQTCRGHVRQLLLEYPRVDLAGLGALSGVESS